MEFNPESIFSSSGLVGNLAGILLLLSMLMRDLFWLRLIAIISGFVGIAFYTFLVPTPVGVFWTACFTLINLIHWAWAIREMRSSKLNLEEQRLKQYLFPEISDPAFKKFLNISSKEDARAHTQLIEQGQMVPRLLLITYGAVDILVDSKVVSTCRAGDLIGEISFLTEELATATAITQTNVRYLSFNRHSLNNLMDKSSELRAAFTALCNVNLSEKLIRKNQAAVKSNSV